ncbi:rhodanese-like domain-containing protein [Terrisporobacter mayombei]|uniref:Sulfurtransferase n=1 Tax=Terrisporobacter mayombei TaxID=1541 RepID=A0ABY9PY10_9FIRM|nr:rhodanese-like domain-containing protein [Terrisporobacter mayombei]MCC3868437.1 rhodanese-like domain-containing protein [Terrisporobacter mayombei]WMT80588.1 Sulfurtransferase [Terrisporobacter mayombei]
MGFLSVLFGNKNVEKVNGEELNHMIKNNKKLLILDVRSSGEFRNGHIPKSKNIPVQEITSKMNTLDLYKDSEVVVYCASGARSSSAANILAKNGFNKIHNLGGIGNYKGKLK